VFHQIILQLFAYQRSDEKVGFVCSLADRVGPSPLFSRPESPSAPRGAGDGMGSPDGLRPYSGGKRGTGGAAGPNNVVRIKKKAYWGPSRGDGWRCSSTHKMEKIPDDHLLSFNKKMLPATWKRLSRHRTIE
jgi:hypothetical protein